MILKDRLEWRTVAMAAACYASWSILVFNPLDIPLVIVVLLLVPVITLHSSLQHECIHGHPFRLAALNDAIVVLPLGLIVPYFRFKQSHLEHHHNANICDPFDDPESWYLEQTFWNRLPPSMKAILRFNNTLAGRMLIGPVVTMVRLAISDWRAICAGDRAIALAWLVHVPSVLIVIAMVNAAGAVPIGLYLVCAYAGMSVLMIRTFLEHQAEKSHRGRSVIIEDRGPLSLLFLNNNLHAVHHAHPSVAWHRLPALYSRNRERFLRLNLGYRYDNYADIIRRYAFRRKEDVPFPHYDRRTQ